jgi:hypothetical protein
MNVTSFLHGLGLEKYKQTFRDNAIDAEVLPERTDANLSALGVLLGHRKKLLKAIAALDPAAKGEAVAPLAGAKSTPRPKTPAARRLPVSSLFPYRHLPGHGPDPTAGCRSGRQAALDYPPRATHPSARSAPTQNGGFC